MFQFPYLRSLVKKHEHCRRFFQKSELICSQVKDKRQDEYIDTRANEKNSSKFKLTCTGEIHWKKLVQVRFQAQNLILEEEKAKKDSRFPSGSWNLDVSSALPYFSNKSPAKKCEHAYNFSFGAHANKKLLKEHKMLTYRNLKETSSQYCYLNYFDDPSQFTAKKYEQESCARCAKWFGGICRSLDAYLEGKKSKTTPEEVKGITRKSKSLMRRVCELCSKILSNRKGLERHMLIHTGEKPFKCDVCLKPFRRKDNCARHKKTAHLFKKPRKPRRRRDLEKRSP